MSTHDHTRLETASGDIVAYLAPNFEVNDTVDNDLFSAPRPRGAPSIVRDERQFTMDVTVQGVFQHSSNLPDAHASALETVFGSLPVTPRDQVDRVARYVNDRALQGGVRAEPLHLYDGPIEWAHTGSSIDWAAGQLPPVAPTEFRPVGEPGAARWEYTLKFAVGTPRAESI